MIDRRGALASIGGLLLAGPAMAAPRPKALRKPWGAPDLEGAWSSASYTELERPEQLKSLVVSPEDAKAWEAVLAKTGGVNVPSDPLGQAQSEFPESGSGLMRINGEIRGSMIVDPADGQLPYSDEALKRLGMGKHRRRRGYDNVEERPQNERCLTAGTGGVPLIAEADANVVEIVQTRDAIVIVGEKYHDARVVRLTGSATPGLPTSWNGESFGRWEGDTLVVETTRFRPGDQLRSDGFYLSGEAKVTERFRRTGPGEISYIFTVDDPATYSRPWRAEVVFGPAPGRMFEYACHEGNYALTSILAAARQGNQPSPTPPATPAAPAKP